MYGVEVNSEVNVSDAQVAAVRAQADEDAKRLCAYLNPKNRIQIPLELMADLAAALRIKAWQKNGLFQFITSRPELATEYSNFTAKFTAKGATWKSRTCGPLSHHVFESWVRNFAWSAPKDLGAECLMQAADDVSDEEIEAIAKMLWQLKRSDSRN